MTDKNHDFFCASTETLGEGSWKICKEFPYLGIEVSVQEYCVTMEKENGKKRQPTAAYAFCFAINCKMRKLSIYLM